jgi:acid-sensing ion channel, other
VINSENFWNITSKFNFSRNCFMSNEKQLKFFKTYNLVNCEHECLASMTLKACGCVQFFMVREQSTRICGSIDEKCFNEVEENFDKVRSKCNCLEPCELNKYHVEVNTDPVEL